MLAFVLSAVIYPGAGQFVQRRIAAGLLYAIPFTAVFVWFLWRALQILVAYYRLAAHPMQAEAEPVSAVSLLVPFLACIAIYVVNVIDAIVAAPRPLRDRR